MSDNQKYYYIRLKADFFTTGEVAIIESMEHGFEYSNLLLKLYLYSLKDNGRLMMNDRIPYNHDMLSKLTGHSVETVKAALDLFEKLGLIEVMENGAIYMMNIQDYIGKSSTEADRQRAYRKRIKRERDGEPEETEESPPEPPAENSPPGTGYSPWNDPEYLRQIRRQSRQ